MVEKKPETAKRLELLKDRKISQTAKMKRLKETARKIIEKENQKLLR